MDQRRNVVVADVTGSNGAVGSIEIRVDDLAFFEGEAIARPVNAMLGATTPIMRKLERAAGSDFADKVRPREPLPVGAAVVTKAGELQVELMVHGVVSSDDEPVTRDTVRLALMSALQRAVAFQIRELAIAPFGLGAGNLDIEDSADVMLEVIGAHMKQASYPTNIIIFAETDLEEEVLKGRFRSSG